MATDLEQIKFGVSVDGTSAKGAISDLTTSLNKLAVATENASKGAQRNAIFSDAQITAVKKYSNSIKNLTVNTKHIQDRVKNLKELSREALKTSDGYEKLVKSANKVANITSGKENIKQIRELRAEHTKLKKEMDAHNAARREYSLLAKDNLSKLESITKENAKDSKIREKAKKDLLKQAEVYNQMDITLKDKSEAAKTAIKEVNAELRTREKIEKGVLQVMQRQAESARAISFWLRQVGRALTMYVTTPLLGIATWGVKFTAEMEAQQKLFDILLGDIEASKRLYEELVEYSASTPYQIKDTTAAVKELLAFGSSELTVLDELRMLGDIAQNDASKLESVVQAFGKVEARGVAHMRELNRFIMAGVPIMASLQQVLNVGTQELFDAVQKGKVSFEAVKQALEMMTSEGGKFYNTSQELSNLLIGRWSVVRDVFDLTAKAFVEDLMPTLLKVANYVIDLLNSIRSMSVEQRTSIRNWALMAAAIGPVLLLLGKVYTGMEAITKVLLAWRTMRLTTQASGFAAGLQAMVSTVHPLAQILTIVAAIGVAIAGWAIKKKMDEAVAGARQIKQEISDLKNLTTSYDIANVLGAQFNVAGLPAPVVTQELVEQYMGATPNWQDSILSYFEERSKAAQDYLNVTKRVRNLINDEFKNIKGVNKKAFFDEMFSFFPSNITELVGWDEMEIAKQLNLVEYVYDSLTKQRVPRLKTFAGDPLAVQKNIFGYQIENLLKDPDKFADEMGPFINHFIDFVAKRFGEDAVKGLRSSLAAVMPSLVSSLDLIGGETSAVIIDALGKIFSISGLVPSLVRDSKDQSFVGKLDAVFSEYFNRAAAVFEDNADLFGKLVTDIGFVPVIQQAIDKELNELGGVAFKDSPAFKTSVAELLNKSTEVGQALYNSLDISGQRFLDAIQNKGFIVDDFIAGFVYLQDALSAQAKRTVKGFETDYYIKDLDKEFIKYLGGTLDEMPYEMKKARAEAVTEGIAELIKAELKKSSVTTFEEFTAFIDNLRVLYPEITEVYLAHFEAIQDADLEKKFITEREKLVENVAGYGLYGEALYRATTDLKDFTTAQKDALVALNSAKDALTALSSASKKTQRYEDIKELMKVLDIDVKALKAMDELKDLDISKIRIDQKQALMNYFEGIYNVSEQERLAAQSLQIYADLVAKIKELFGEVGFGEVVAGGLSQGLTEELLLARQQVADFGKSPLQLAKEKYGTQLADITLPAGTKDEIKELFELLSKIENLNIWEQIKSTLWTSALTPLVEAFEQIGEAMVDASKAGMTFGEMMHGMVTSILNALPMMLLQAGLQAIIANAWDWKGWALVGASALGYLLKGAYSAGTQPAETNAPLAPSSITYNAKGNAYNRGDIVTAATMFRTRRGLGVMGEDRPEAILPLSRGPDGSLGVVARGGSGVVVPVSVTVVNESGTPISADTEQHIGPDGERQITMFIRKAVTSGLSNGEYDKIMGARYGVKNRGAL